MRIAPLALLALLWVDAAAPAAAPADFRPDPRSVKRSGPAYRYPQAGWIVLHIEGDPYDRGYQHGQLLAPEITAYLRCYSAIQNSKAPTEGWKTTRTLINALFLRRFDKEYLEEMKGIADGAAAAGAKYDDRKVDLVDVVALNCWAELETLDAALDATPNGLEGIRFKQPDAKPAPKPMHCSAFAATGPATADGKIVFGHNTMYDLYPSLFSNVWLDIKPSKGHRVLMQSYPGGIQSGYDYYMNDAGLLVAETTIAQTRFDPKGLSLASRIRRALQYADNIDSAVEILQKDNNGLYTNEWLLADIKTNEIAMFELGTTKSKLYRSSKNEWLGGTEGFYWGCNNARDLQVRLDTLPTTDGKPANMVWRPTDRDRAWLKLYDKNKGKIDVGFGKEAYATAPLVSAITCDAKYTTTALAKELKTWALTGPPLGKSWQPTEDEKSKYPEIRPMVSNPWALLHAAPPPDEKAAGPEVVDLPDKVGDADNKDKKDDRETILRTEDRSGTEPAWHGTLLTKADADAWLGAAFTEYEKIFSLEKTLKKDAKDGKLSESDRDRLAVELFAHRSNYLAAARIKGDVPLSKIVSDLRSDEWYRIASGKGVLLLNELKRIVGDDEFEKLMESFGKEHAGKEATTAQFRAHIEKAAGKKLDGFFEAWLETPGLPTLKLSDVALASGAEPPYFLTGQVQKEGGAVKDLDVSYFLEKGETTRSMPLDGAKNRFRFEVAERPSRVVVDRYGQTAKTNGGSFSVLSFYAEPEQALIVYGTRDEAATQREAAEALQEAIRTRWANITVPMKSDKEVTEDDLKTHHILLIGRPDSNAVVERFRKALPVEFGTRSFVARDDAYAHAGSGVIAAAENPLNKRYSLVVLAGLGAEATTQLPAVLMKKDQSSAEVLIVPSGGKVKALVIPPKELVFEFPAK